ncbi:MAG: PAS domain S-box protein [Thermodesulfobacteriota bacterium]
MGSIQVDSDEKMRILTNEIERLRQRIAELERHEEERERKEETLLDLFNATEEVALLMDREGTILVANQSASRLYGIPVEKLPRASIYDLIPRDRVQSAKQKVKALLETRKPVRFEGKLEDKVFENSLYPVLEDEKEVQRIALYVRDITERKRLAAILKETEEKYRNIYENAMEGIFQIGPDGRFISANPSLAHIHGYESPEALIKEGRNIASMYVTPEDHRRLINLLFEKGAVQNYEAEMIRRDGTPQWISVNVRLVKDDQGKPLYYEGTMMDITNRKMAEEALAESEERYRTAIEHSNDGVSMIRGETIQYVNRRFVEIFGYERREEIIGKSVLIVVHPDDQDMVIMMNRRRQRGEPVPVRYEFKGITKDGRVIYIEVSATSIVYRGTPEYLVYLRDVTERKVAEELMRNERDRFRTLSENAPFGIIMIDKEGRFEYLNPKFKEMFGYSLEDVPNSVEWFRKAFPDLKTRKEVISTWIDYLRSTKPGEKVPRTLPATCKDGTQKIIHFIPVRLATGEYIVTLDDITERMQAHEALVKSHQELERLNRAKTKAVNHISHELRTPLAVIHGSIRLLKKKLKSFPTDVDLKTNIDTLERNLERISEISRETDEIFRISQQLEAAATLEDLHGLWQRIEDLPDLPPDVRSHFEAFKGWINEYLSGKVEEFQSINLLPFVLDTLERVKQLAGHRKIRFQVDGKNDLFIFLDPLILGNVVEGLLRNAIENTPDGGTIRLGVEQKNGKIVLSITDYGVGITKENQAYLFDGLFHTKETELYASKQPYDFGAGGKGLDLLRMKVYAQRFGFELSMASKRCVHIPTDQHLCPGDLSKCPHVQTAKECADSGWTTFTVAFQPMKVSQPGHI